MIMFVNDLPEEILMKIFSYLSHLDLFCTVRHVCSTWNCVTMSQPLWRSFDMEVERRDIKKRLNPDDEKLLVNMLFTVGKKIREFRFDTKYIPLHLKQNTDNTITKSLHNFICNKSVVSDITMCKGSEYRTAECNQEEYLKNCGFNLNGEHFSSDLVDKHEISSCDLNCDLENSYCDLTYEANSHNCDQDTTGTSGCVSNLEIEKDCDAKSEDMMVKRHFEDTGEQTLNRQLDVLEIRETTNSLSFLHINKILRCYGSIRILHISTTKLLSEFSVNHVSYLAKVEQLEISSISKHEEENCLGGNDISDVNKCFQILFESLKNITALSTNELSNEALRCLLGNNKKLHHLALRNCQDVTKDGFTDMPELSQLTCLDISGTFVGDKCLAVISKNIPNIRDFLMEDCVYVTDIGLSFIGKHWSKLQTLVIDKSETSGSRNITNVGLEYVAEGCVQLKVLVAQYCQGINDIGLYALASNCSDLSVLKIAGCAGIGDSGIEAIAHHCKYLRHLNLEMCIKVTHIGIRTLIEKCLWLNKLKADGCTFIKDLKINCGLPESPRTQKHSHIRKLSLGFCSNISDNAIKEIANFCPDLRELYLTGTFLVTDNAIDYLLQKCKFLKVLDISCVSILGISEFTNEVLWSVSKHGQNIEKLMLRRNFKINKDGVGNLLRCNHKLKELHITVWTENNRNASGVFIHDCQHICDEITKRGQKATIRNSQSKQSNMKFASIEIIL